MLYKAFISYSHAADGKLAPAIQSALHRIAKPFYRIRALRVFRDKTSLSADPALWRSIEEALAESEYFLLMASPMAAQSPWVKQEVEWWLKNRSIEKMLILLTEGDIFWNENARDFDWSRTNSLPENLREQFREVPNYIDLRWARSEASLSLRHPQFHDASVTVAAKLHGKRKDDLAGEDVRQHRITTWVSVGTVAAILVFAGTATWQAIEAYQQRNAAEERRQIAEYQEKRAVKEKNLKEKQQQIALARQLAAQADLMAEQQAHTLSLSLLLDVESLRRNPSAEAAERLNFRLSLLPHCLARLKHNGEVKALAFSEDAKWLVTASSKGIVTVWQVPGGKQLLNIRQEDGWPITSVRLSRDKRLMAIKASNWKARGEVVFVWDVTARREIMRTPLFFNHDTPLAFTPDGKYLMVDTRESTEGYVLSLWDIEQGKVTAKIPLQPAAGSNNYFLLSPNGKYLAGIEGNRLWIRDLVKGRSVGEIFSDGTIKPASFSGNGDFLITVTDGYARVWEVAPPDAKAGFFGDKDATLPPKQTKAIYIGRVSRVAYDPEHRYLAAVQDRAVRIWELGSGLEVQRLTSEHAINDVGFSSDGRHLAVAGDDGRAAICENGSRDRARGLYGVFITERGPFFVDGLGTTVASIHDLRSGRVIREIPQEEKIRALALSRSGEILAIAQGKRVSLWDIAKAERIRFRNLDDVILGLAFSPRSNTLALASYKRVEILEVKSGKIAGSFTYTNADPIPGWLLPGDDALTQTTGSPTDRVDLSFSPNGKLLQILRYSDPVARLWDVSRGKELWRRGGSEDRLTADSEYVLARGRDQLTVKDLEGKTAFRTSLPTGSNEFFHASSSDGEQIAVGDGHVVEIWNAGAGAKTAELAVDWGDCLSMSSMALDPEGKFLATACNRRDETGVAQIWEVATQKLAARTGHPGFISRVSYTPDGKLLIIESRQATRAWVWRPEELVRETCTRLIRKDLTREEWRQYLGDEPYRKTCSNLRSDK